MSERLKPFVAFATLDEDMCGRPKVTAHSQFFDTPGTHTVPVVVTPLLPDDPKPGETWTPDDWSEHAGQEVEVLTAPFGHGLVMVRLPAGGWTTYHVSRLRRPPALKKFRLRDRRFADWQQGHADIIAEDKAAAIKALADMLEEVG